MEFKFGGSEINQRTIIGHPSGLFVLFFTEMWERFSYYGMRALVVLFLTSSLLDEGWGWERDKALLLYGWYTSLVYLTPLLGGIIADKLIGYRNAVVIGALLMTLGHAAMALEGTGTPFFYAGLLLLILGNGLFKPNISSIVGNLYTPNSNDRDGAYTIFYMGINAGAFLGILLCGYVGEKVGWHWGFGLAGIFMFFGMLQFWLAQGIFGTIGLSPKKAIEAKETGESTLEAIEDVIEETQDSKVVRDRIIVIGVFAFFTIFFWWAFEQAGGSMTIFAKDYTNRVLEGGAATAFKVINTILIIIPLVIVTIVLGYLFKQIFSKYPLSNLFLGISFVLIWAIGIWLIQNDFKTVSYAVSYADVNGVQDTTEVRSSEVYQLKEEVPITINKAYEFYNPLDSINRQNTVRKNILWDTEGEELGYYFRGKVAKITQKKLKGVFWSTDTYAEVKTTNGKGVEIREQLFVAPDTTFTVGQEVFLKMNQKISYSTSPKKGSVQAMVTEIKDNEVEVGASWFGILNSFFIIALAPLFSKLWKSKLNPSGPIKFAIGLILLGIGFAVLSYGAFGIPQGAKTASVSMLWLILAYLFLTLGELCLSPVGLSYVSKLAPPKLVGLMFGVWFIANFISHFLAGLTGSYIDAITEAYSMTVFFLIFTIIPILSGLILWMLSPILVKKMHGIR